MSLLDEIECISDLPKGVSEETKDKAKIEVIVYHIKTTKAFHERYPDNEYSPYSPLLKEVIKGETTFKKELNKFLKKYGRGKLVNYGKQKVRLMDGSGYTKFIFEPGIISIFRGASEYLDTSTKLLDEEIERLRPGLIDRLYKD